MSLIQFPLCLFLIPEHCLAFQKCRQRQREVIEGVGNCTTPLKTLNYQGHKLMIQKLVAKVLNISDI